MCALHVSIVSCIAWFCLCAYVSVLRVCVCVCVCPQNAQLTSNADRGGLRIQYSRNPFGRKRDYAGGMIDPNMRQPDYMSAPVHPGGEPVYPGAEAVYPGAERGTCCCTGMHSVMLTRRRRRAVRAVPYMLAESQVLGILQTLMGLCLQYSCHLGLRQCPQLRCVHTLCSSGGANTVCPGADP